MKGLPRHRMVQLHRFLKVFFCFIVVVGVLFIAVHPTFAQNNDALANGTGIMNAIVRAGTSFVLWIARMFLGITIAFLRIFTQLAAYNDFIDSPAVIVGWYMVRDLANMFFVVALLAIAFGTMLGLEQYEWKKSLVKLVGAAILINFSRLIIGVAIDAAHVFTITFLDAVQGVAAGNLIGMLHLDKVFSLSTGGLAPNDDLNGSLFIAGVMALIFSLISMITIGSYLVVMAFRIVVLWVLIILSPLAFIFSAIPQTKGYADEFWGEVSKHIIVAPVMMFFLWLAFATMGNGQINNHVGVRSGGIGTADSAALLNLPNNSSGSVSILELSTWENMSGFIIAIIFLLVGLERVQQIGATGSSVVGSAIDFSKRAAGVVSGFAAARFVAGKIGEGAAAAPGLVAKGLYNATLATAVETGIVNPLKRIPDQWRIFRSKPVPIKTQMGKPAKAKELVDEAGNSREISYDEHVAGLKEYTNPNTNKRYLISPEDYKEGFRQVNDAGELVTKSGRTKQREEAVVRKRAEYERATKADKEAGLANDQGFKLQMDPNGKKVLVQAKDASSPDGLKWIDDGYEFDKSWKPNYFQRRYQKLVESRKISEKIEKQAGNREELVDKRTTGVPRKLFGLEAWTGTPDAEDRIEQGQLNAEQARSAAKTKEFHVLGEKMVMESARFKDGRFVEEKATVARQIADHEAKADATQALLDHVLQQAKLASITQYDKAAKKFVGNKLLRAKVFGKIQTEAVEAQRGKFEATQQSDLATNEAATFAAIGAKIAGHRAEHEEGIKFAIEEKRAENLYLETHDGQHELSAEAVLEKEQVREEEKTKRLVAEATANVFGEAGSDTLTPDQVSAQRLLADIEAERLRTVRREKEVGSVETAAKTDAANALPGELEGAAAADIETKRAEATTKRLEAEAAKVATKAKEDVIIDTEGEQIVTAAEEAETKEMQEAARLLASNLKAADLQRKALAETEAAAETAGIKVIEEGARTAALQTPEGRAALLGQKQAEIKATAFTEESKEEEETAKRAASEIERRSLLRSSRAKIRTAAQSASLKRLEERSKSQATAFERASVQLAKEQELLASSLAEVTKRLENQARLRLVVDNTKGSAYQSFVKSQSANRIIQDRMSSKEKAVVGAEMQQRMEDALLVEKRAQILQRSGNKPQADLLRSRSHVWQYAAAKALEEKTTLGYNQNHNAILSDVEQEVVHNARGIQTPTTALTQAIEQYSKDYAEMDYEPFVANLETNLIAMLKKRADQAAGIGPGVTTDDKAAMAGLLAHGQKNNWLDDAIWKFMGGPLKAEIQASLGWKDTEFDNKKINDIMSIFAAGGDLKFSSIHTKVADMMDAAKKQLNMSVSEFMDKFSQGIATGFSAAEQAVLTSANGGVDVTTDATLSKNNVDYYMDQLEDSQAQLQFISNLRDRAAVSSHPENGGHGVFVTLANGRTMYVLTGQQIARDSVIGEVKKTPTGNRAAMQTHAIANIDESTGFVTRIREEDARDVRSGINTSNDYRGTNARFELHTGGLSSADNKTEYKSELDNGSFLVTGKKADGTYSSRHEWLQKFEQTRQRYTDIENAYTAGGSGAINGIATAEEAKLQETSDNVVNNIFAKRIAANPNDFLISMAHLSGGVNENDALSQGKMNLKVLVKGKEVTIDNINKLIELYNKGEFNRGIVPTKQLSNYK